MMLSVDPDARTSNASSDSSSSSLSPTCNPNAIGSAPAGRDAWARLRAQLRTAAEREQAPQQKISGWHRVRNLNGVDLPQAGKTSTWAGRILAQLQAASVGDSAHRQQWQRAFRGVSLVRTLFAPARPYFAPASRRASFAGARAKCSVVPAVSIDNKHMPLALEATPTEAQEMNAMSIELPHETPSGPDPAKDGWRGSVLGTIVDGVYESHADVQARKRIRLLPEVAQQVERLWDCADKRVERMGLKGYLDFHLSVFYYISAREGVATAQVDLMEAWEVSEKQSLTRARPREDLALMPGLPPC